MPDNQREVVVKFAFCHFTGGLNNGLRLLGLQTELQVNLGSAFLEHSKSSDNWNWHSLPFSTDLEVHKRPLGLGTPVPVGWYLEWTKSIFLDSDVRAHHSECLKVYLIILT